MIDPKKQANTSIERLAESDSQPLIFFKTSGDSKDQFSINLRFTIVMGRTVLLEEVGESIDPILVSRINRRISERMESIKSGFETNHSYLITHLSSC